MSNNSTTSTRNQLLAALPAKDRERFLADCTCVDLALNTVVYQEGDPITAVYFPIDSFISMLTIVGHSTLEVGMVGNEGVCGHAPILSGGIGPLRGLVQGAGTAWQIKRTDLLRHIETMPALRQLLDRYVNVLLCQLAQTSACTRFHVVEQRLARWLLMTQDRAHADSFVVTQEFLAYMLGVRRSGVTAAASVLKRRKIIEYWRGNMTILHRGRLEAAACECYRADLQTYTRGLGVRTKS